MTIETNSLDILKAAVNKLAEGYQHLPEHEVTYDQDKAQAVLLQVAEAMWDNYPYPHPQYAAGFSTICFDQFYSNIDCFN